MTLSSEQYHQKTSYNRHQMTGHSLDWKNQPTVFKSYPGVPLTELPREIQFPETSFFTLFQEDHPEKRKVPQSLSKEDLSRILLLTYSLTAKARHPGGDFYYRSVASAGALYPTEIYLTSRGVENLDNGLYHFSIAHHGLARLRSGDLAAACDADAGNKNIGADLLLFRNFFSERLEVSGSIVSLPLDGHGPRDRAPFPFL
jgi:hypothetical protein